MASIPIVTPDAAALSQGPFTRQLTEPAKAQFPLSTAMGPSGFKDPVASVAYLANRFFGGAAEHKARNFARDEMAHAGKMERLNATFQSIMQDPNVTDDVKQQVASDYHETVGQMGLQTLKDSKADKKNPLVNMLSQAFEGMSGGKMPTRGGKDVDPMTKVGEWWSLAKSDQGSRSKQVQAASTAMQAKVKALQAQGVHPAEMQSHLVREINHLHSLTKDPKQTQTIFTAIMSGAPTPTEQFVREQTQALLSGQQAGQPSATQAPPVTLPGRLSVVPTLEKMPPAAPVIDMARGADGGYRAGEVPPAIQKVSLGPPPGQAIDQDVSPVTGQIVPQTVMQAPVARLEQGPPETAIPAGTPTDERGNPLFSPILQKTLAPLGIGGTTTVMHGDTPTEAVRNLQGLWVDAQGNVLEGARPATAADLAQRQYIVTGTDDATGKRGVFVVNMATGDKKLVPGVTPEAFGGSGINPLTRQRTAVSLLADDIFGQLSHRLGPNATIEDFLGAAHSAAPSDPGQASMYWSAVSQAALKWPRLANEDAQKLTRMIQQMAGVPSEGASPLGIRFDIRTPEGGGISAVPVPTGGSRLAAPSPAQAPAPTPSPAPSPAPAGYSQEERTRAVGRFATPVR
jgi:hypothetical protein